MASKKAKQKKVLDKAKQLVLKNKKGKAKAKPKQRYPEGQNAPQSKAYQIDNDKTQVAKATGYRFTKEGAKRLGKTESDRPTQAEIEKYRNQTFKVKGKVNKSGPKGTGDGSFRYIYIERRADKADLKRNQKLAHGGETENQWGVFYNGKLMFKESSEQDAHKSAKMLKSEVDMPFAVSVEKIDDDYAKGGSIKDKRERVIDYYLNNDVFDDPHTYDLSDEDLEDAKKSKSYKKIEDAIVKYHGLDDDENVEERFETLGLEDDEYAKVEDEGAIESGEIKDWDDYKVIRFIKEDLDEYYDDNEDYFQRASEIGLKYDKKKKTWSGYLTFAKGGKTNELYEHFEFINENGKALDDYFNDYLDEDGEVVYVPQEDWHLFKMVDENNDIIESHAYAKGGQINKFKVGDKVVYQHEGEFGWEEIDEAQHGGYESGVHEVSEVDYSKGNESIKLDGDDQWVHPNHFELHDKYAKGGKTKYSPTENDVREFQEYVFSFYGKNGIDEDIFDGGVTTEEVLLATNQYLSFCAKNPDLWGKGDSMDRESVRDIMLYHRGTKVENLEFKHLIGAMKRTTILEYGGILLPMTGGVNADPRFDIYNTTMFAEDGAMLELGGENPDEKLKVVIRVTVYEDDYEEGEGKLVNAYTVNWLKNPIVKADDLLEYLYDNVYLSRYAQDYVIDDDGIIHTSRLEDADGREASESEIEKWKKGEMKLYSAHYSIIVEAVGQTRIPSQSELHDVTDIPMYEDGGEMAKGGELKNKLKYLKEKVDGYFPNIEPKKETSYYLWEIPNNEKVSFIIERRSIYGDVGSSFYVYDKDFKYKGSANQIQGFSNVKPIKITQNDVHFADGGEMAKGGKIIDQYKQFPKGSFKREKGVWNAWTPAQRLHFLNDHGREFKYNLREEYKNKISKVDYDGLRNLADDEYLQEHEIFIYVNDALNKHIKEGQYADGGKIVKRRYLQGRGKNVFTFGYGMPKDSYDMFGTKGGTEYFIMPNGKVYKKTKENMNLFEFIGTQDEYAKGGKTHEQGYDDREDESLAMRHGKIATKDFVGSHKRREHSRRDDARFETRNKK